MVRIITTDTKVRVFGFAIFSSCVVLAKLANNLFLELAISWGLNLEMNDKLR